jgi:hypothetical protein
MPTTRRLSSKASLHDENGSTVQEWSGRTAPKTVSPATILDAWRGGFRAWRGGLTGPLRENRKQFHGAFVGETRLDEEAAIQAMQLQASQHGLTFGLKATTTALMRVARENYKRLTEETFTEQQKADKPALTKVVRSR